MGNKIATILFWLFAIVLAAVCAWYNIRPEIARSNPVRFIGAVTLCAVVVFGVRECIRAVRGRSVSPTSLATAAFWLGVVGFFALAGIMAWAVLTK